MSVIIYSIRQTDMFFCFFFCHEHASQSVGRCFFKQFGCTCYKSCKWRNRILSSNHVIMLSMNQAFIHTIMFKDALFASWVFFSLTMGIIFSNDASVSPFLLTRFHLLLRVFFFQSYSSFLSKVMFFIRFLSSFENIGFFRNSIWSPCRSVNPSVQSSDCLSVSVGFWLGPSDFP